MRGHGYTNYSIATEQSCGADPRCRPSTGLRISRCLAGRANASRSHVCRIEPAPLAAANEWLRFYETFWTERFDALDALLKAEDADAMQAPKQGELS
jgi:hypothetical protein